MKQLGHGVSKVNWTTTFNFVVKKYAGYFVGILFTLVVAALYRVRESLDDVPVPYTLLNPL